jgi:endonuclease/exonuclease/phosphatase family metal-dependent hydrolase
MFIYTKFPIVNTGKIEFENTKGNCVQWVDVKIKNETFRIYNVHLQSIKFDERDYDIMKLNGNNDTIINKAESIMLKMKEAWQVRAKQAELLKDHIESCPHKIILCGDFNDTPISYTYNTVVGNLKDAFIESGSGFSQTYSGRMPSFRIDYILADKSFDIYNYELGDKYWSDHKLVQTTLHIKK